MSLTGWTLRLRSWAYGLTGSALQELVVRQPVHRNFRLRKFPLRLVTECLTSAGAVFHDPSIGLTGEEASSVARLRYVEIRVLVPRTQRAEAEAALRQLVVSVCTV